MQTMFALLNIYAHIILLDRCVMLLLYLLYCCYCCLYPKTKCTRQQTFVVTSFMHTAVRMQSTL